MKIILNKKFKLLKKIYKQNPEIYILDIGCGNHSATSTKDKFPNCKYFGLDINKNYNNDQNDLILIEKFFEIDLSKLQFNEIPDNKFDVILMTHVIEHLYNGDEVIIKLLPKLKKGGYFFIEFPSFRSTKLPSMRGCLNFFDDETHCRIYSLTELYNLFLKNEIKILEGGTRRNWLYILLIPIRIPIELIKYGFVRGSVFWDLLGFSEYLFVQKQK
jgi:2-polyprenyl-3-methyl-5-hydroxy-6-metoxy-1,4-benzoquinol methylase